MREAMVLSLLVALTLCACGDTPLDYPGEAAYGEVQTSESGLQWVTIEEGEGSEPVDGQTVTVHYSGYLLDDGTMFDSSVDSGEPFGFVLGSHEVIPGWEEGVATMKIGEKRKLIIPSRLAYGDSGIPGLIPGGATLVFDVELLGAQ